MEMLLYTDRETAFRLLREVPFHETALQPLVAFDRAAVLQLTYRAAAVDLDCPGGKAILQLIREKYPDMPVITFSVSDSDDPHHCGSRSSTGIRRALTKIPVGKPAPLPGREHFWRQLLRSKITDYHLLKQTALLCGISPGDSFTLLRISLFTPLQFGEVEWQRMTAPVLTALKALLVPPLETEALIEDDYAHYWLILRENSPGNFALGNLALGDLGLGDLAGRCRLFMDFCREQYSSAGICMAEGCTPDDLIGAVEQIRLVSRDAGAAQEKLLHTGTYSFGGYSTADLMEEFRRTLPDEGAEVFFERLNGLLDRLELNSNLLQMMRVDLEKLLRAAFAEKLPDDPSPLEDSYCLILAQQAHFNRASLLRYLHAVVHPVWKHFPPAAVYPEPVRRIIAYLDEHLTEPYSREVLGNAIGLNPNYLAALFKESTGRSISAWRGMRQMDLALKLLTETKLSIARIAEQTGFGDYTYFCSAFRKQYGMSPGEYRKRRKR